MLAVNIAIILGLGVLFIAVGYYLSRAVSTADEFILGTGKLGVAMGSASLLAFWITGNTTLAAPEAAYTTGILGAVGYGFLGGIAVILFAPIATRIHEVIPHGRTVGDFYSARFGGTNYYVFLIFLLIYVFGILITQGIGGGVILEQVFGIPYLLAVVLSFVIVITYSMLGGFQSVTGVAFFQIILILVAVAGVVPVIFFRQGASNVYQGILENNPDLLSLTLPAGLLFMFGGAMFGIGEVFMDNTFWQRAYAVRRDRLLPAFIISGIGWAFVPIAVSTLAFIALAEGLQPEQVNQVAPLVAQRYGGNFASYMFLVVVWSAILSTAAASLNAFASVILNDLVPRFRPNLGDPEQKRYGAVITVVVGVLALLLTLPQFTSMLQMLIFIGVINAAFIYPITLGLFWRRMTPTAALLAGVVSPVVGYFVYFTVGSLQGIVVSGWVSLLLCVGVSLAARQSFDWSILHHYGRRGVGDAE
jgi:Na+/proline symporter